MKQLHNAQDAIEQAIEGGWLYNGGFKADLVKIEANGMYVRYYYHDDNTESHHTRFERSIAVAEVFTDPLFWQALGKVRRWNEKQVYSNTEGWIGSWREYASSWFQKKLSNGNEIAFWRSLP